tara:strand:+ start:4631 stop:5224 length:594 start_codon:yes stop_codon:yes gene_type:complete
MADVKLYRCFPTTVGEFSYYPNDIEMKDMISHITTTKKNHGYHTEDDLHTISYFADFRDEILNVNKTYMKDLKYEYDKLEITGMWANKLHVGEAHPPHTHSNNFLSGVYYLKASNNTSPIQFFDPRPQANVLRPRNEPIWENSSMLQFASVKGIGFIFPSWLLHWVPPTQDERISISWNIIVRGNYGEPDTLQNAYI